MKTFKAEDAFVTIDGVKIDPLPRGVTVAGLSEIISQVRGRPSFIIESDLKEYTVTVYCHGKMSDRIWKAIRDLIPVTTWLKFEHRSHKWLREKKFEAAWMDTRGDTYRTSGSSVRIGT